MIEKFSKIVDLLLVALFVWFIVTLTASSGLVGFFFAMGFLFVALIILVAVMTLLDRFATGKWWFLEHEQ